MYRAGWILLVLGIVLPAFPAAGLYPSGPFALANALMWTDAFEAGRPTPPFGALVLFAFALFTNVVFFLPPVIGRRPILSWPARIFVVVALVVDVGLVFALPIFAQTLGYWLWLLGVTAIAWAGISMGDSATASTPVLKAPVPKVRHKPSRKNAPPANLPQARPPRALLGGPLLDRLATTEVPFVIWIALGWLVFWLAVTAIHHYGLDARLMVAARADEDAREATTLTRNFHDPGALIAPVDVFRFTQTLAQFEKETSNQVAVAVYEHAPQGALEEFTLRTAELSRLGKMGVDNGAILFIFRADHAARIEVGYGLEGVLTDAGTHRILEERLAPSFARGDYAQGIDDTLAAVMGQVREAYKSDRMPGAATILYRQVKAELPKLARKAWPAVSAIDTGGRLGIAFFGTMLVAILISGVWEAIRWGGAAATAALNLYSQRAIGRGIGKLEWAPLVDSMKVLILLGIPLAAAVGTVIVAGGGAFGGAGATIRW